MPLGPRDACGSGWIAANICSLAELYCSTRMYVHLLLCAICNPPYSVTSFPDKSPQFMVTSFQLKKKKTKKTPYCYLGGIWALHSGYGSCTGGLLLCHRSRCRWPCMRSPEADSCTVGARPCWAGSWVKPMPCSPGRGQKQNGSFFCCVFLLGHLPTHLTCVTPKPTAGMVWGVSKYIY